jgi:two-component system phosphate regulon sensor histidine kinase PhoR
MSVRLEPDCRILGNKQNLQRMIANVLDNALKYTYPKGKVSVHLERDEHDISIAISDTGMGIPLSDQERVFDRFSAVTKADFRKVVVWV